MPYKTVCVKCHVHLKVPDRVIGKAVRCPACKHVNPIPKPAQDEEDRFSAWIEEDVEHWVEEQEKAWQKRLRQEQERQRQAAEARHAHARRSLRELLREEPQPPQDQAPPPIQVADVSPGPERPLVVASSPVAAVPANPSAAAAPPQASRVDHGGVVAVDEAKAQAYPQVLLVTEPRPYLVVEQVSQKGVLLAFDAHFLEEEAFRRSMPVACVFGGQTDATRGLLAKPLAFLDQTQAEIRDAGTVEAGHEESVGVDFDPRILLAHMGTLERMPRPFHLVMPYYVSRASAHLSLECGTARTHDGRTKCRVLIPHGPYALAWLRQVNGVCGPECELLEQDVRRLWGAAWEQLSEEVRQRLGAWCAFEPHEIFCFYANDAEFAHKDEGLAGVVLTNRRLIYHHYHCQGAVSLSDAAVGLVLKPDGDAAAMLVQDEEGCHRAGRLRVTDVPHLMAALRGSKLKIEVRLAAGRPEGPPIAR